MIGIWLWRHHTFPESSPAYPHIQTASVGDESQCSLHSFFFHLFFFPSLFCRFFPEYLFFALLTQSRHWALLLRNGLVPPLVVRQGWSIGLLVYRAFTYMTSQSKLIIFFASVHTTTQILRLLAENTLEWGALFY